MRVLAVAEGAPAAFGSIVGGFPPWVVQECTQPAEMVHVQMLLLPAQRSELSCFGISLPDLVSPLGFIRSPSLPQVVFPDREPFLKERARHAKLTPDRPVQQAGECLTFADGQVLGSMEEQRAVQPQVFSDTTDLVPVAPGARWRLDHRAASWACRSVRRAWPDRVASA